MALARQGVRLCTYGDMLRLPGTSRSLADAQADGRARRGRLLGGAGGGARAAPPRRAGLASSRPASRPPRWPPPPRPWPPPPPNFSILSVHKYVPAAMEVVAASKEKRIDGYLAAGHAAIITGWAIFEPFARRTGSPVAVAGFEPLDILAALVEVTELIREGRPEVANVYPRCVTRQGNLPAQRALWQVFQARDGSWRGIAEVPGGNLDLTPAFAHLDAREAVPDRHLRGARRRRPSRNRWAASAGRSCWAWPPPRTARSSGGRAGPSRRWAPAWCRRRGSAGSGTPTAGCRTLRESPHDRPGPRSASP